MKSNKILKTLQFMNKIVWKLFKKFCKVINISPYFVGNYNNCSYKNEKSNYSA